MKTGYKPIQLITTYNIDKSRSWFHGIPEAMFSNVSESLQIPIQLIRTTGEHYSNNFEKALFHAKTLGAEICVFGDIDLEDHLQWCRERCKNVGIEACFPLWKENRKKLVYEFIDEGYIANITIVNTKLLSSSFIGKVLTRPLVDQIEQNGADACGENGEYHTFVSDGPIFKNSIDLNLGNMIMENEYCILPIIDN